MANYLLEVEMQFTWWICLALAIWIIYTVDHLIDSLKLKVSEGKRRKFYQKHFLKLLIATTFLSVVTSIISLVYLDFEIIIFGLILGSLTTTYLLLILIFGQQKKVWLQKELYVAIIYTAGIWGSGLLMTEIKITIETLILIVIFLLLVFADILIFSVYEYEQDKKNKFISLISLAGIKKVRLFISISLIMSAIGFLFLIFTVKEKSFIAAIILMLMTIQLFLIFRYNESLEKNDKYRYLGEAVFFFPALIVLF